MSLGPNLQRRGDGLLFRRRIPRRAETFFRSRFLSLPLQTHLLREGRRMAAHATRFTDAAFTLVVACGGGMLDAQDTERVVVDLLRFELEARETARAVAPARAGAEIDAALAIEEATRQILVRAIAHHDYAAVAHPVNAALARLGVAIPLDAPDWRMVARRAAIGLVAVCEENARREQGVYADGARLLAVALAPADGASGAASVSAPPSAAPSARPSIAPLAAGPIAWASLPASTASDHDAVAMRAACLSNRAVPGAPARQPTSAPIPTASAIGARPTASSATCSPSARVAAAKAIDNAPRRANAPVGRTPGFAYRQPPQDLPGAPDGLCLLDRHIEEFAAWKEAEKTGWLNNAGCRLSSMRAVIREAFGATTCGEATEEFWREFFDLYARLPKNHHKDGFTTFECITAADAARDQRSIEVEALRATDASRGDIDTALVEAATADRRVSAATLYAYQQLAQQIMVFAVKKGRAPTNTMVDVIWKKKKLEDMQAAERDAPRLPWGDKAQALFASTVFTTRQDDPGEPLFWLPLIAYFTGLRMEEVAQLKLVDFEKVEGAPIIRIQKGERQHLKNLSARRVIPLPDALIDLGLLQLVALRFAQDQQWLFPNLERSKDRDRLSGPFSKAFTAYRQENGLYEPQRDFHSLRADFNVGMKRADVILEVRKKLMGHRMDDVTEKHYDPEGSGIDRFLAAVNARKFDISGIRRPFATGITDEPVRPRFRLIQ